MWHLAKDFVHNNIFKPLSEGFPGGSVVKNPPAIQETACNTGDLGFISSAGDMGLIPGPGRSHMLWSNQACVPLLSLCSGSQSHPRALSVQV